MNAINANVVEALQVAGFTVVPRRHLPVVASQFDTELRDGEKDIDVFLANIRVSSFLNEGEISAIAITRSGNPILALHWNGGTISVHVASLVNGRLVVVHRGVLGGERIAHDQGHNNSVETACKATAGQPQNAAGLRNVYEVYRGRSVAA